MDNYFYRHHEEQLQQLIGNPNSRYVQVTNTGTQEDQVDRDRDRFPQWSHEETKQFLSLRSDFDKSFTKTKRNKPLWEAISVKLQLKGFSRTPDQCKSKWKNLVTRFKGSQSSMEVEANKNVPFNEEIRGILAKGKGIQVEEWEDELEVEDDHQEQEHDQEKKVERSKRRRVEMKKIKMMRNIDEEVKSVFREFRKQQLELEAKWIEAMEARENERKLKEQEWRRNMEALHKERMELERRWREREEARRANEEARSERVHALINAILSKLDEKGL